MKPKNNHNLLIIIFLAATLIILLIYTVGFFNVAPYTGLRIQNSTNSIEYIFDPEQKDKLQLTDQIISIGSIPINAETDKAIMDLWKSMSPGDTVEIEVLREGTPVSVEWEFTGPTKEERNSRLASQWFLPYFFYVIGLIIFISVRPKDRLWRLLVSFSILTALWLSMGSGPSRFSLWNADHLLAIITWFMIAVILHLHWVFPQPFNRIPARVNTFIYISLYVGAAILSSYEILHPDENLFTSGFLIGFLLSLILMIVHFIVQKESREKITIIMKMTAAALTPFAMIIFIQLLKLPVSQPIQAGALLGLPLLPAGYLFAIWQGNLTNNKFRANRILTIYLYLLLVFTFAFPILSLMTDKNGRIDSLFVLIVILAIGLLTLLTYNGFQRFVERYFLRIPIPLSNILETYASVLINTQNEKSISSIMGEVILPSLMIRQSLLVEFQSSTYSRIIDARGIPQNDRPNTNQIFQLLSFEQIVLLEDSKQQLPENLRWVNVVISLHFDEDLIGVWLLGQRDPDDYYDEETLRLIQAIAQQTAIAIINHQRSTRLQILYEANINRSEAERASLARDLHDDTLNELALLQRKFPDEELGARLSEITNSLRKVIHGLRPTMISYGLETALYDLADTLNEINNDEIVSVDLECSHHTLHPDTELHIFRIIQQACENALQHAEASSIKITGNINKDQIKIIVKDDGKGIQDNMGQDLLALAEANHFGMAGMHERAALIKASLDIQSSPGAGTSVILELLDHLYPQ